MKTIAGIVSFGPEGVVRLTPCSPTLSRLPIIPCQSPLKHSEYPYKYQITVVQPIETKLWIMMARTFFRPTSPAIKERQARVISMTRLVQRIMKPVLPVSR